MGLPLTEVEVLKFGNNCLGSDTLQDLYDEKNPLWYKLDNAAKIYPAIRSANRSNVFRVSVLLKETVDPDKLTQAIKIILPRFPSFAVCMHRGLFWYYMEHNDNIPEVSPDTDNPCMYMHWNDNNGFFVQGSLLQQEDIVGMLSFSY